MMSKGPGSLLLKIIIFPDKATNAYDYDSAASFDSWVGLRNQDDTTVDHNEDSDEMSTKPSGKLPK